MTAILEAREVAAGYRGHAIIRSLNLSVNAGEVVALVGANGAGKSTTLLTLAGAIPALSGEVRLHGRSTTDPVYKRARAGMAFVPDTRGVFMRLTTEENLRLGGGDVGHAIDLFPELDALRPRRAALLSGGEQQMLSLGRALARRPKALLVDEVSLGLAPTVVKRLLEALRRAAHDEGVGVLLVEQYVQQALHYADRMYVLRRGSIVMHGTVEEVAPHLHTAYL